MKVLYIGQYTQGTTSRMRGETLCEVTQSNVFDTIDTHIPFFRTHRLFRSFGFRTKRGPLISTINAYILKNLKSTYDLIWVDKGVFISYRTSKELRKQTKVLVHYTPDTAFYENQSPHFNKSIDLYDFIITTKSFDLNNYYSYIDKSKVLFTPQGFDKTVHYARNTFAEKEKHVLFIGLNEPSREEMIRFLLKNNIAVRLAGKNWQSFVKNNTYPHLSFLGEGLFKEAYAKEVSNAFFGLGMLSKRFPELHTTRTFEIPACGTALITERNAETVKYYAEDEVLFYSTPEELVEKVNYCLQNPNELEKITRKGTTKVYTEGFDYQSQIFNLCKTMQIV